jgi:aldose 1-epimerase
MTIGQNFGATVGRYIGRINHGGSFTIDSVKYQLQTHGRSISHGGRPGFANRVWTAKQLSPSTLQLNYLSPDGESGFPGNLNITLIYKVTNDNALDISYEATTDKPTVVNLANHSFFNISGDLSTDILDEQLYINGNFITPYDSTKCVTGKFMPVEGTPFDFTHTRRIGDRIDDDNFQLHVTGGYDHCWVLNTKGNIKTVAASLYDARSGRTLDVFTTQPGVQIYTANGLRGRIIGKKGIAYPRRNSICFETMHFQDSPNIPQFPSTVLRPGEKYNNRTIYKFGVRR